MTTIAYRAGILAADSRCTELDNDVVSKCDKLYRKQVPGEGEVIIATAGDNAPGLLFVDWYGTGAPSPENLIHGEADFTCLVLSKKGLFEYNKWCRGERVKGRFYAIGSGAKAALGALHMGADARMAVKIACRIDPYSAGPVVAMRLK